MKIIPLEQGSSEWKEYRRSKIMASDACTIMGTTSFKTLEQLFREKMMGDEQYQTEAMRRGSEEEPLFRESLNKQSHTHFIPIVGESKSHAWLGASFDGYDIKTNSIIEIKIPSKKCDIFSLRKDYYPQLQQQMFVSGISTIALCALIEGKQIIIFVQFDPIYWDEYLKKAEEFHDRMLNFNPPLPRHASVQNNQMASLAERYASIGEQIEVLEAERDSVKNSMLLFLDGKEAVVGNLKITKIVKPGAVDYSKIDALKDIDLDSYRKPSSEYWRISTNG